MSLHVIPVTSSGINVLGISLGSDSGAAIVSNIHGLLCATNEERYNRTKQTKEFPFHSINHVLSTTNLSLKNLHAIALSHYADICAYDLIRYNKIRIAKMMEAMSSDEDKLFFEQVGEFWTKCESDKDYYTYHLKSNYGSKLSSDLLKHLIGHALGTYDLPEIIRVDHHVAHAFSAWGTSNYPLDEQCLIFTMDGFGDGRSVAFHEMEPGENKFRTVETMPLACSLGLLYQFTTGAVGYKMHEQEGKLTGLAARGKPVYIQDFVSIMDYVRGLESNHTTLKTSPIIDFDIFEKYEAKVFQVVKRILADRGHDVETIADIACSLQTVVENLAVDFIRFFMEQCEKPTNVCLAGGLFANVIINQKIAKLPNVKKLWICPHMGDGGTSVGAAFAQLFDTTYIRNNELKSIYMGYNPYHDEIQWSYHRLTNCMLSKCDDKASVLAKAINDGYIVANYNGPMEWGPRALCNRSIHFNCTDKDVSLWLNKQLGRTETMPFAPVICDVDAKDMFLDYNDVTKEAAKYMTINFTASDLFKELCPGAVHIDGTVRAQVVSRDDHPFIYTALIRYKKLTGKPAFINTSFNAHGEPIIRTPEEAVTRFIESNIHILFLGDYILSHPNIQTLPRFKSITGENKDNPGDNLN